MNKYAVRGYAYVPVLVEIVVEAANESAAGHQAEKDFEAAQHRSRFIVDNTQDNAAVHSFRWSEVLPNDQDQTRPAQIPANE